MEKLNQSRLYKSLCKFKGAEGNIDNLTTQFKEIAQTTFYSGHFLVNNAKRIYITEIEFYYHEDDGNIKDIVKYHRNYDKEELEYFPIGSLHPHRSGVDVTFENPEKKYRASFLIRGYEIRDIDYNFIENNERNKHTRPTYLWDDLFGVVSFFASNNGSIQWIDEDDKSSESQPIRIDKRVGIRPEKNHDWRYIKITSKNE